MFVVVVVLLVLDCHAAGHHRARLLLLALRLGLGLEGAHGLVVGHQRRWLLGSWRGQMAGGLCWRWWLERRENGRDHGLTRPA